MRCSSRMETDCKGRLQLGAGSPSSRIYRDKRRATKCFRGGSRAGCELQATPLPLQVLPKCACPSALRCPNRVARTKAKSGLIAKIYHCKSTGPQIASLSKMEIRRVLSGGRAVCIFSCGFVVAGFSPLSTAEIVLHKVPTIAGEQAPSFPQNLARSHLGATLGFISSSISDNRVLSSLITGDPAAEYALPSGVTSLMLSLPQIENLDRIALLCGAEGTLSIATSNANLPPESRQWHNASSQNLTSSVTVNVGPAEAKYVKLTFDVTAPGRIAGLGVYGSSSVGSLALRRGLQKGMPKSEPASFGFVSLTNADLKARTIYVSSGAAGASNMIGNQIATSHSFAPDDASPVAIVDLGKVYWLRRLSAAYGARRGNLEFYVLQALPSAPASGTLPDALKLNDDVFASFKLAGSAIDNGTQGRASVDFLPTAGRYVLIQWTPAAQEDGSFSIAEVAAFGSDQSNPLLAVNLNVGGQNASEEGKDFPANRSDGKEVIEAKDFKDIPAEGPGEAAPPAEGPPPNLPLPPPFTFIPQIQPISR